MTQIPIAAYFDRYHWGCTEVEPELWQSSFSLENEQEYDVYVMLGAEWVHFAVSPVVARVDEACRGRLHDSLLRLNLVMRLAYFGLDEEADVALLAELPRAGFEYEQFAVVLNALTHYTEELAAELQRIAVEPGYHSAKLGGILLSATEFSSQDRE